MGGYGLKMARVCCKYVTVSLVPVSALFLAVVFFFGALSLPILYTELAKKYQYGVVIDADSSNTTLYIYRVEVPVNGIIEEVHYIRDQCSLDSFEVNPSGAGAVVTSLIEMSLNLIKDIRVPKDLVNSTHIYLGATAGMRLLRSRNPNASSEILAASYAAMKKSNYLAHESARIISGQEEAAGGWVTANYLKPSKMGEYGSLVMGESSAEIAFLGTAPESGPSCFYTQESLYNVSHSIYARSYLCYGQKEALARFLGHLISTNPHQGESVAVPNPCLPVNSTLNYTYSEINTTCVTGHIAEQVFSTILNFPSDFAVTDNVMFNGTGDVKQCLEEVTKAFNITACQSLKCKGQCVPPPVNGTFIGFSNFQSIARLFDIDDLVFSKSGHQLLQTFKDKCMSILKEKGMATEKCFYGIFMGFLMEEGFGMTDKAKNDWTVKFRSQIKELSKFSSFGPFGWTLGYLMNRTTPLTYPGTYYQDSRPYTAVDLVVGMILLTLLCTIFVIFFFLTFYACKKALKAHNGYQSIS